MPKPGLEARVSLQLTGLRPENCRVIFSSKMPWEELQGRDEPLFPKNDSGCPSPPSTPLEDAQMLSHPTAVRRAEKRLLG
jgi:hypothetical protein